MDLVVAFDLGADVMPEASEEPERRTVLGGRFAEVEKLGTAGSRSRSTIRAARAARAASDMTDQRGPRPARAARRRFRSDSCCRDGVAICGLCALALARAQSHWRREDDGPWRPRAVEHTKCLVCSRESHGSRCGDRAGARPWAFSGHFVSSSERPRTSLFAGLYGWRDPDSNRGHHDFQSWDRTSLTGPKSLVSHGFFVEPSG